MGTTPPTSDRGGPDPGPRDPVTDLDPVEPDDSGAADDYDDDLDGEPEGDSSDGSDDDSPEDGPDSPLTPISVADLLRREGYEPDPELEWDAGPPTPAEAETEVIASGPSRLRKVLIGAGSAVALGSIAATILLVTTAGDDAPVTIPVDPRPGSAAPYLAPLPSSTAPAPTSEPADEETGAPAAVVAPQIVQVPATSDAVVVPPPVADAGQPADEPDDAGGDGGGDAGGDDEEQAPKDDSDDGDDSADDAGNGAGGAADRDESDAPQQERPAPNPVGDLLGGLGSVLGVSR